MAHDNALDLANRDARFSAAFFRIGAILIFLSFTALYIVYVFRQHISLFCEAEFLHIPFLRALTDGTMTWDIFLTRFGEHLFPGYNILLAINYYLFSINGAFGTAIFTLSLCAGAALVAHKLFLSRSDVGWPELLGVLLVSGLILLSPTNNPMFLSMALAASVGTALFVLAAYLLDSSVSNPRWITILAVCALVPITVLFFLGGYSIGLIAAFLALSAIWIVRVPREWPKAALLVAVTLVSAVIYTAIVYRGIVPSTAKALWANADVIVRFVLVMTGSSVLGRAVHEATPLMPVYYATGAVLIVLSAMAMWHFVRHAERASLFALALLIYSSVTIAMVTFARYGNGVEGAMGQWYNSHTHFLPVACLYYIYLRLKAGRRIRDAVAPILIGAVISAAAIGGYRADWRKAPYAAEWKRTIQFEVPGVMAFEDQIVGKNDHFQTLLWDLPTAKAGMQFLYEHRLWLFRHNPLTFVIPPDKWLVAEHNATIVCPYGSKQVQFRLHRPPEWPPSVVQVRTPSATQEIAVHNEIVRVELQPDLAAVLLSGKDTDQSRPVTSTADRRSLVAVVSDISCGNDR